MASPLSRVMDGEPVKAKLLVKQRQATIAAPKASEEDGTAAWCSMRETQKFRLPASKGAATRWLLALIMALPLTP